MDASSESPHIAWPFVDELSPGEQFDSIFAVRKAELRRTRENKSFLVLDLGDKTGHIKANLWEDAETFLNALPVGTIVKVRAIPQEYAGSLQLKLNLIRPVTDADEYESDRFLPTSENDPAGDWTALREAIERTQHSGLKQLLTGLFVDDEEFAARFQHAPAGKMWHHAYLGGLLEHTASLVGLAERICAHYSQLKRDLLVAGACLHDIGKLWELQADTVIDYTVRGRLEGHIVIGAEFLQRRMDSIEDLDEITAVQLKHLVLSHQGLHENGCPVVPMTREAFVLYYLDETDSKLNALDRILKKHAGEPGDFTEWVNLLERHIYKG